MQITGTLITIDAVCLSKMSRADLRRVYKLQKMLNKLAKYMKGGEWSERIQKGNKTKVKGVDND